LKSMTIAIFNEKIAGAISSINRKSGSEKYSTGFFNW
jgi:hypothetical protein